MVKCMNPFETPEKGTPIEIIADINPTPQRSFDPDDCIGEGDGIKLSSYDEVELIAKGGEYRGGKGYDIMRCRKNEDPAGTYVVVLGHWNDGYVE